MTLPYEQLIKVSETKLTLEEIKNLRQEMIDLDMAPENWVDNAIERAVLTGGDLDTVTAWAYGCLEGMCSRPCGSDVISPLLH